MTWSEAENKASSIGSPIDGQPGCLSTEGPIMKTTKPVTYGCSPNDSWRKRNNSKPVTFIRTVKHKTL